MRLVRTVQAAIGLAATGGMMGVLSGSALAADSGSGTTPQSAPSLNQSLPMGPINNVIPSPTLPQTPTRGDQQQASPSDPSKPVNSLVPEKDAPADKQGAAPVVQPETPATLAKKPAADHQVAPADKPVVAGEVHAATSHPVPATVGPRPPDKPEVVTISTPVVESPLSDNPVVYHSTVFTIKPTITNRVAPAIVDLAASIPSAPDQNKGQAPTQSSGLLGNLTAQLAGTVVPQFLMGYADPIRHMALTLNLVVMTLLLINVFTFTYGLWLRRGGFATAARSDSPAAAFLSVATPSLSGYASLPLRLHSPLFDGGRNESFHTVPVHNAFRKEERS